MRPRRAAVPRNCTGVLPALDADAEWLLSSGSQRGSHRGGHIELKPVNGVILLSSKGGLEVFEKKSPPGGPQPFNSVCPKLFSKDVSRLPTLKKGNRHIKYRYQQRTEPPIEKEREPRFVELPLSSALLEMRSPPFEHYTIET
jgi:hypothetical protein